MFNYFFHLPPLTSERSDGRGSGPAVRYKKLGPLRSELSLPNEGTAAGCGGEGEKAVGEGRGKNE